MENIDTEALKKAWYSFEEIKKIKLSLDNFEKTWIEYDLEDSFDRVNKKVFSKFSTQNV